ncbi:hypothetical protein E4T39_06170 [Aureobasidium subglaciale]|nr:hypothetical protein E4T39_06170 [Aureobasidium subglaciale]
MHNGHVNTAGHPGDQNSLHEQQSHELKHSPQHRTTSEKHQPTSSNSNPVDEHPEDVADLEKYPEGGLEAWLVVLGSWCAMTAGMGILNTIGTLHAWISTHQLSTYSSSSVGWIFSTFPFFLYFAGVQIGPLFDVYGARVLVATGSVGFVCE